VVLARTSSNEARFQAKGSTSSFHSAMKARMRSSMSSRLSKLATRRRLRWMIENHCSIWFIHELRPARPPARAAVVRAFVTLGLSLAEERVSPAPPAAPLPDRCDAPPET
jgi:hypothetical protein